MSGFPAPPHSPGEPALDDERASQAQPLDCFSTGQSRPPSMQEPARRLARPVARSVPGGWSSSSPARCSPWLSRVWLFRPPPPAVETTLPRADAGGGPAAPPRRACRSRTVRRSVVVDAAGSVARPGLYRLPPGARVNDLIRAAGGLRPGADPDRLNLAAPLADGQRLYVPKVGELTAPPPARSDRRQRWRHEPDGDDRIHRAAGWRRSGSATVPIDLNTATADQLDTLPGVGPSTAAAILDYRTQHGPFRSVDELLDVRGIGDAKLAALRAKVRV